MVKKELVENLTRALADKFPIVNQETTCAPTTGFQTTTQCHLIDSKSFDTENNPINEVDNVHTPND